MTDREQLATTIANGLQLAPNVRVIGVKGDRVIVQTPNGQTFVVTVAPQFEDDGEDCT
jgi:hypothetical protein